LLHTVKPKAKTPLKRGGKEQEGMVSDGEIVVDEQAAAQEIAVLLMIKQCSPGAWAILYIKRRTTMRRNESKQTALRNQWCQDQAMKTVQW